jgi:molybdenum cofactor synthesis domain-containing protein
MIRALAVTVSNRAAAGVYEDRSGPVLVELLREAGCDIVDGPLVIPDGEAVEQVLRDSVTAEYDVAVTTGGTGLTPGDLTPEMTRRVIDREIPGIPEALRAAGADAGVPSAILSRGLAGVARRTLIINLPGSSGGVRDGMKVLRPILVHAVDQIRGGDHPRQGEAQRPAEGHRAAEAARPPDGTAPPAEAGPAEAGHQGHAGHASPGGHGETPHQHASDDATGQKLMP